MNLQKTKNFLLKNKTMIALTILILILLIGIGFTIYWIVGKTGNIPWQKCIIPYTFNPGFTDSEKEQIKKYMNIITDASKTYPNDQGIIFIEKSNQIEFITFNKTQDTNECGDSNVAKQLGGQTINFSSNCISERTVVHELLHTLGFIHEQCRKDRDNYVKINYDNIIDDSKSQFNITSNIISDKVITSTDYDYNSIMHYSSYAFSKNGEKTIEFNKPVIQNNNQLSDIDKKRLQMYYNIWK